MRDVTIVYDRRIADKDADEAVRHSGRFRRILWYLLWSLVGAQIALALTVSSSPVLRAAMLTLNSLMALLLLRQYWTARRFARRLETLGAPCTLTVGSSGIRACNGDGLLLAWSTLAIFVETPAFFVFVTELGGGFALARQALGPEQERELRSAVASWASDALPRGQVVHGTVPRNA